MRRLGSKSPSAFVLANTAATVSVTACALLFLLARRRRDGKRRAERCANLARRASAIRGLPIRSLEDAEEFVEMEGLKNVAARGDGDDEGKDGMLAIFPGSFNPPTRVHVEICNEVLKMDDVDSIWVDMTVHTDKKAYVAGVLAHRLKMAEIAAEDVPGVGVTSLMTQLGETVGLTSQYFEVLRCLSGGRRIAWVMGSDVAMDMIGWKEEGKAKKCISFCDCVIVYKRHHEEADVRQLFEMIAGKETTDKKIRIESLPESFEVVSSSSAQDAIVEIADTVPKSVLRYVYAQSDLTDSYKRQAIERRKKAAKKKPVGKRWSLDEHHGECHTCNAQFGMFNRKHHCRDCGHIFCGNCSSKYKALKRSKSSETVRHCDSCYDKAE